MIAALIPRDEFERLAALRRYDVLDSAAETEFDAVTALIAAICETPIAVVSLIDADRQWFKSHHGLDAAQTSRDISFCGHAILEPDRVMIVPDALADERFADNPLVTAGPRIRFYAGMPLVTSDGYALGTLCVIDTKARVLTEHQTQTLRLAANSILMLLEQRSSIAKLRLAAEERRNVELELRFEIAQRRRVEVQLNFSASHDELTRLPNRAQFATRLRIALDRHRSSGNPFAVCFIDLDRFKQVNDTLGHRVGDQLLVEVGRRLTTVIRAGDAVARLGGDEFTMLIDGAGDKHAAAVLGQRIATTFNTKLPVAGSDIGVTASVGIVLVNDASYTSLGDILRDADIAMYASKERGRNRCTTFTTELREQFSRANEMQLAVRRGLDEEQFELAYQPVVSVQTGRDRCPAFEALLRWRQADGTLTSAAEFIEPAERSGLIVELGDWVLRQACAQANRWQVEGHQPIVVAVNVSALQLAEPNFAEHVKEIVRKSALDPRLLALEVTESLLIGDVESSIAILHDLRRFGIKIYLDDFGTGYSSLNYLRRFPLDRIKIDRSFVSGVGDDLADPVIVNSIVSLAHKLDLRVVAEGVETHRQLAALAQLGCDYAQGYLFSRAVPARKATELLRTWNEPAGSISAA